MQLKSWRRHGHVCKRMEAVDAVVAKPKKNNFFKSIQGLFLSALRVQDLFRKNSEVLSCIVNQTILEVGHKTFRVLLQHRHVIVGSFA